MPTLRHETIIKAVGDPWSPADANKAPRVSSDARRVIGVEHYLGVLLSGVHAPPIAQAAAIVEWTGSDYVAVQQEGLDAGFGNNGVRFISTGVVELQLDFQMASRDHWIASARGFGTKEHVYGADVGSLGKTQTLTRVLVGKWNNAFAEWRWTRGNNSFILEVFGDRR